MNTDIKQNNEQHSSKYTKVDGDRRRRHKINKWMMYKLEQVLSFITQYWPFAKMKAQLDDRN